MADIMAPIEFYYMPESPPCRAVEMVAEMLGVKLNKHYINLATKEHFKDEYLKVNPLHKVPFIVDGDLAMGESRAIMMYLVNKYMPDNEHLYPKDPKQRATIDELLFYEMGTYYLASSKLFYPMFMGKKELDTDNESAYKEVLQYLDRRLADNSGVKFMLGDNLTIADISFAASFSIPYACGYSLHEYKHILAYLDRMKSALPNYSAINDQPVGNMKQYIESKKAID